MTKTTKKSFKNAPKPPKGELAPELLSFVNGKDYAPGAAKQLENQAAEIEKTSRLSIDLPESLHRRYKSALAANGLKMRPQLVAFIEEQIKDLEKQPA